MKKLLLLFVGVLVMPLCYGQDITDAVRYSTGDVKGTARFRGMSGAFGALGGDMSAVSINPAGSAIFNSTHLSFTLGTEAVDNTAEYFGNYNNSSDSFFKFSQAGSAFVFKNNDQSSPFNKLVLGFAYERTGNFDNTFFASGINNNSIDSYFLANAQGLPLEEISAFPGESYTYAYGEIGAAYGSQHQQAFLGYESFILEPDTFQDNNTNYTSNIAPGSFRQDYSFASSGYNSKFTMNGAAQIEDNIYLGVNLNSHFLNYNQSTYLYETNDNTGSVVKEVGFRNNLSTYGSGFSFQVGGIAKVGDILRLGIAYDSPIWYRLNDETTQYITTTREESDNYIRQIIDPRIVNIFAYYKIQTPSKLTGSMALVLGKIGLLSFDYSRKNYSNTKFSPSSDPHFSDQNRLITNSLKAANSYKVGGEVRHKQLSLRGGYRFEQSPYRDSNIQDDLTGYSFGLGYNFGNTRFDFAYDQAKQTSSHQLYNIGLTDTANVDSKYSNFTFTIAVTL
ncbi:MAG: outer membrane protein transport protein [Flavobacteriaceae bacterium]|nr:outer membrane protein transport protein [Flavobacteriaceae bacterium]